MRYVLEIGYKGTHFAGYQIQPNAHTVQAELEQALQTALRCRVATQAAGRTDAGVHASQLYVHFDHEGPLSARLVHSLNGILPADVAVRTLYMATTPDFHARFSALSRAYVYQIVLQKSPLLQDTSLWVRRSLDIHRMHAAAAMLLQYEDFASFCKAHGDNKTTLCQLHEAGWEVLPDRWCFHVRANRFLRGMVRALVGSLLWVGMGKISPEEFRTIIEARDRSQAGPNVPAQGLILKAVTYPPGCMKAV